MKGRNASKIIFVILFYFVGLTISLMYKQNYHTDEMFSYGLANHVGSRKFLNNYEKGVTYDDPYKIWMDYLTVSPEHRFNYRNVWINQIQDVHPPLYYVLLHTICSFFPGTFSKWFAGIINIVFGIVAVQALDRLLRELLASLDSKLRYAILLGFIGAEVHVVTFLRMYMMVMCLVTILGAILVKGIEHSMKKKDYIGLFMLSLCGALTHYYYIVYLVLSSFVFVILMFRQKRIKDALLYSVDMCVTGIASVAVFPAMIQHVFFGYRGKESIGNMKNLSIKGYILRLGKFYEFVDREVFGGWLTYILAIGLLIIVCNFLFGEIRFHSNQSYKVQKYLLLLIPVFIFYVFVAKSAVFNSNRYIFPIYAIVYVLFWAVVQELLSYFQFHDRRLWIAYVLCALLMISGIKSPNEYMYSESGKFISKVEKKYHGQDAVMIVKSDVGAVRSFEEVSRYGSITFIKQKNVDQILQLKWIEDKDEFMLMTGKTSDLDKVQKLLPEFTAEKVGNWGGYTTTYHMVRE